MASTLSSKTIKSTYKFFLLTYILTLFHSSIFSKEKINFEFENTSIKDALQILINKYNTPLIFQDSIPNKIINSTCRECTKEDALSKILKDTNLLWTKSNLQYIVYKSRHSMEFFISGRIVDKETEEIIPYANIFLPSLEIGAISNPNGFFSISNINVKSCSLLISYIGYETNKLILNFPKDDSKIHKFSLIPKVLSSEEISIDGNPKEFMEKAKYPGQISFSPRHISTLPNLGEVDIFRALQFLPGVQLGLGETSNLYVRGGSPDQNLILLDGLPIYHTSHMFGFISGISANAIKDIQVYKGSIPIQYGGKVSSVISITSRSGNSLKPRGALYGNLLSQGITAELPILKRGSWIINYRKSNSHSDYSKLYTSIQKYVTGDDKFNLLSQSASEDNSQKTYYDIESSYNDIISSASLLINASNRISMTYINGIDSVFKDRSYYGFTTILGEDSIVVKEETNINNQGFVINWYSNWNHNYNSQFTFGKYMFEEKYSSNQNFESSENSLFKINSADENLLFSDNFFYFHQEYSGLKNHTLSSGLQENYLQLHYKKSNEDGTISNQISTKKNIYSYALFFEDNWTPSLNLKINSGIRVHYYMNTKKYFPEPRLSLRYNIHPRLSLEASLGQHHQHIHNIKNSSNKGTLENNLLLSSSFIPIISSSNYNIGLNWNNMDYSISTNIYYRLLNNIFQLKNSFIPHDQETYFDSNIDLGLGNKKGIELIIRRKRGIILGWLSYHYNKTIYDFPNLNNGQSYLASYDKPHELKAVATTLIWNIDISANWVISSGGLYTELDNMYVEPGTGYNIIINQNQNQMRLPPIHHLDISISKTWELSPLVLNVSFSIYNIYNKNNYSHKRYNPYTSQLSVSNVSMLGITPSVNLKISF